jgi:hypothetical protein
MRRALILLVVVPALLAGCGSDSKDKKADPAADKAAIDAALLVLADLPSGFDESEPDPDDDPPEEARQNFADCLGVETTIFDDTPGSQKVTSNDFSNEAGVNISNEIEVHPTKDTVDDGWDVYADDKFVDCLETFFDEAFAAEFPAEAGITVGDVAVDRLEVKDVGDRATGFRSVIPVSQGGNSDDLVFDILLSQRGRAGVTLMAFAQNTGFDVATSTGLLRTVVDRLGDKVS